MLCFSGGLKRQPSFSLDIKEEGTEIDIEIYLNCISALLKLAQVIINFMFVFASLVGDFACYFF
jgi:hypothetical protein